MPVMNMKKNFAKTSYESWNGIKEMLISGQNSAKATVNGTAKDLQGDYGDDMVNTGLLIPPRFKQSSASNES